MNLPPQPLDLPAGHSVRAGTPRDWLALSWVIETSPWIYWAAGRRGVRDLLQDAQSYLWLQGRLLRGALFLARRRDPVAELVVVAQRGEEDAELLFGQVLPHAEGEQAAAGVQWVSVSDAPAWLLEALGPRGYRYQDTVITYETERLAVAAEGNAEVLVEPATLADLPAVVALDVAAFDSFWHFGARTLAQAIEGPSIFLVARLGTEVVGYLMADRWQEGAFIGRLAVAPARQGHGIGRRLLLEAFARFRAEGMLRVALNTQVDNRRSRRLYEGLGFRLTGEEHIIWGKRIGAAAEEGR